MVIYTTISNFYGGLLRVRLLIILLFGYLTVFSLPSYNDISTNSDTIGQYQKFEITIDLTADFFNPFNFEQITLQGHFISPTGTIIFVDGFYFQDFLLNYPDPLVPDGDPVWKIRFSPTEIGTWTYEIICTDATGTTYSATYTIECIPSENPGFVRDSDSHFHQFDNGTPYFTIGMNMCWSGEEDGNYVYEQWIESLADNGANFFKIIMAPWSFGLEWDNTGLGNYTNRLDIAFWIDWILDKAEQEDIYMQICYLIHDEVSVLSSNQWAFSPYNAANGGPCNNTWDFYTNETAVTYFKRKMRYINARWGWSSNLAYWELFSEADNTGDYNDHRNEINNWLIEIGQYLESLDKNNHLISTGYAFFERDPVIWNHDMTDFTQIHRYSLNDLELKLHSGTGIYLDEYDKPNLVGEYGLAHDPSEIIDLDPDGIAFHNSLWATSLSGSFGTGLTWWWDHYIDTQNLYYHFKPVSNFMSSVVDLNIKDYQPLSVHTTADVNLDLVIKPSFYDLFTPAPEDQFTVETTGNLIPVVNNLAIMLYGYVFSSSRNPPHFHVNYTQPGQFSLVTGDNGLLSNIKIWIDGTNVLNTSAQTNTIYTVNVPEGSHVIFVENTGNFYMEVDSYLFHNYIPVCRSFALEEPSGIIGWLQNINYNYEYINEYGDPPPIEGGAMSFENLDEGYYEVEWWNGSTGLIDSISLLSNANDTLHITVPQVLWDAAYKIRQISSEITPLFTASTTEICSGDTIEFTDNSTGVITSRLWQFPGGIPSTSVEVNPSVQYILQGDYDVTLTLYNAYDSAVLVKNAYISVDSIPHIIQHPDDTTIYILENAAFDVLSPGNMTYQWQISYPNNRLWNNISDNQQYSGSNTFQLLINAATPDLFQTKYRCITSGECGPNDTSSHAVLSVIPQDWDYVHTGIIHTIYVPLAANPTIDDVPILADDYIGVFYIDGEDTICGGLQQWNGSNGISISAFGDDPTTGQKDGFINGENIYWRIYSRINDNSYDATATYLYGPEHFIADSISKLSDLNAFIPMYHTIDIPAGWSGISSYLIPDSDSIEFIFNPLGDNLIILLDMYNIYWPEIPVNTIITWDPLTGYKIKVETDTQLTIKGYEEAEKTLMLPSGWSILPVLSSDDVSTINTGIFSDLGDTLTIVKDIAGDRVYWPEVNVYTLTVLKPGKAYLILVSEECTLTFPETGSGVIDDTQ